MGGKSDKPELPEQKNGDSPSQDTHAERSSGAPESEPQEKPASGLDPSPPPEPISPPFWDTGSTAEPDTSHTSDTPPSTDLNKESERVDPACCDEPLSPPLPEKATYPVVAQPIHVPADDPIWGESPDEFWDSVRQRVGKFCGISLDQKDTERLAERIRSTLFDSSPKALAFDRFRKSHSEQFVCIDEIEADTVWFIGDLHGDLLSCITLLKYISKFEDRCKVSKHKICFLGDLIDDGDLDNDLLFYFLLLISACRGEFAFVVGNHDEGLYRDSDSKEYRSSVSPSDFCDRLNAKPPTSAFRELADAAIDFFSKAPRALLLPDGLLVAHGGVPHTDLLATLKTPEDFNSPAALTDFVWTRLHERAKRKIPNRTTRGCSLGIEDFDAFCEHASRVLERPVRAMIRGHDHIGERFLIHERYKKHPVVTINAMSYKQRDVFGPFERKPVVARWRMGQPLEIHQIEIPPDLISHFYKSDTEEEISSEISPEAPQQE